MPEKVQFLFRDEFISVDEVIKKLSAFEDLCLESGDLRGVFATAYLHITRSIEKGLGDSVFTDATWTRIYLIRFANLYREAVMNDEKGNLNLVPKSWKISFSLAKEKEGLIIQHLLLGINAHINHDLAIALFDVSIDPERVQKYGDHNRINDVLAKATEQMKREVSVKYAPILKRLDKKTGYVSDEITNFSIPKARDHAWSFAIALTRAATPTESRILRRALDDQAAVLARLIMASPTRDPRVTRTVTTIKWVDGFAASVRKIFRRS
ncbi:MAG: hypothetical protein EA359_07850 [Balneolaceae bacterium]|nr:MAG: hypothetical protein EA359_07850 [Balneolaceae bacterium]